MLNAILITPPAVFLIIFIVMIFLARILSALAFRRKIPSKESKKAYACGEDFKEHLIQPDYSQFFPFAFFFTILHVVALVIATVPMESLETFAIAVVYIIGAVIGLSILLRR